MNHWWYDYDDFHSSLTFACDTSTIYLFLWSFHLFPAEWTKFRRFKKFTTGDPGKNETKNGASNEAGIDATRVIGTQSFIYKSIFVFCSRFLNLGYSTILVIYW